MEKFTRAKFEKESIEFFQKFLFLFEYKGNVKKFYKGFFLFS